MVCEGTPMKLLNPAERLAVVRHYDRRMLRSTDNAVDVPPGMLTAGDVAKLMGGMHIGSVQRIRSDMPPAVKRRCPECGEPMWRRNDGTVEFHANRWNDTCPYEGAMAAMAS